MIKLIIFADDLTGALDTSVQFAKIGIATRVSLLCELSESAVEDGTAEILAIDTASRHDSPVQAYQKLSLLSLKAREYGIPYLYKKTDSALRGNVGVELAAVWEATGVAQLPFIPSYPDNHCVTIHGEQVINGIKLHHSTIGMDAFNTVTHSNVRQIIRQQYDMPVMEAGRPEDAVQSFSGIVVYDASSNEDLWHIGQVLMEQNRLSVCAGCAGFAAVLPELLDFERTQGHAGEYLYERVLIVSGSLDENSIRQMDYLRRKEHLVITLTDQLDLHLPVLKDEAVNRMVQQASNAIHNAGVVAIESVGAHNKSHIFPESRDTVTKHIARITKEIIDRNSIDTLIVFGGDTCRGILTALGCHTVTPRFELAPGVVQATAYIEGRELSLISKAGRFSAAAALDKVLQSQTPRT